MSEVKNKLIKPPIVEQLPELISEHKNLEKALRKSEKKYLQLIKAYIDAQDEEREWMSVEIHDRVIQPMVEVFHHLQRLIPDTSKYPDVENGLNQCLQIMDGAICETRSVMNGFYPVTLGRYGLATLIKEELNRLKTEMKCEVDLSLNEMLCPNKIIETTLYRVFHEALLNIRKHSQATRVSAQLCINDHYIELQVKDNGIGFEPEPLSNKPGGLACMRHRTELLEGTFKIKSRLGQGTVICSKLPY